MTIKVIRLHPTPKLAWACVPKNKKGNSPRFKGTTTATVSITENCPEAVVIEKFKEDGYSHVYLG